MGLLGYPEISAHETIVWGRPFQSRMVREKNDWRKTSVSANGSFSYIVFFCVSLWSASQLELVLGHGYLIDDDLVEKGKTMIPTAFVKGLQFSLFIIFVTLL